MWQGTGAIKGFAIALTLGITLNLFTSLFITRLVFDIMAKYTTFRTMRMLKFFSKPNIDFLKIGHTMLPVSCVAIVLILGFMVYKGKAICGIDFTGGTRLTYEYTERVPEMTVMEELAKVGFPSAKVSYKTNIAQNSKIIEIILPSNDLSIDGKNKTINPVEQVRDILNKANPKSNFSKGEEVTIGGLIGWEFSKAAIIAFILANIGMIIYLSLRFELAYGVAATLANLHDIIIATGIFLLCGGELSLQVLAALLTILGFSVNDTIIVFDRIREDVGLVKNKSYKEIINLSINQTLSRTVITSFTVFLVTLIMYIMGGNSMRDFVFVMLVGVVAGTYSSIFVASPIISVWHKRLGIGLTADQKENNKVVIR
jgi:SecD/SecF fusion protein